MNEAWVVLDLGFGDAGKGSITDFLVRDRGATLVVRFNGGAQAGHTVVSPGGRHHTFAQFGAGTFAGARGLLGPAFLLHPLGMWLEAEHLREVGIWDPWALTEVDERARVITPFQQAAGRIRERLRGRDAHGTCGVGIGECAADALAFPDDALTARDLGNEGRVRRYLAAQRDRKRAEMLALGAAGDADLALLEDPELISRVVEAWRAVASVLRVISPEATAARIARSPGVVFEGAQGVLLDETWGFHPHTTWSDCTAAGARALAGDRPVSVLGVVRAYGVRHGPGPFPTEGALEVREVHNGDDGAQGRFRVGALDGVLLRYALEVCGGVDAMAVTCLDRVGPTTPTCDAYQGEAPDGLARGGAPVRELEPGPRADLGHRQRLGEWLRTVRPELVARDPVAFVEEVSGRTVRLVGRGPTAADKRWIHAPGR